MVKDWDIDITNRNKLLYVDLHEVWRYRDIPQHLFFLPVLTGTALQSSIPVYQPDDEGDFFSYNIPKIINDYTMF